MTLVMENFNPILGALPVLTDEQLSSLTMPVLYIAGTNDIAIDSTQAAHRLSRFVSQAKIQLNQSAHVITSVADQIIPFLTNEL